MSPGAYSTKVVQNAVPSGRSAFYHGVLASHTKGAVGGRPCESHVEPSVVTSGLIVNSVCVCRA